MLEGQHVWVEGEDGILVNPVWVGDLAHGVRLAVESSHGGIFHLAGAETLSLRELLVLMGGMANRKPKIETRITGNLRRHDACFRRADELLGYRPTVSLRNGLKQLLSASECAE